MQCTLVCVFGDVLSMEWFTVTESSSELTASTDSSVGCHSSDVTGCVCHRKLATGEDAGPLPNALKSHTCGRRKQVQHSTLFRPSNLFTTQQRASNAALWPRPRLRFRERCKNGGSGCRTLKQPSSAPLARRYATEGFHASTFTSAPCAAACDTMLRRASRTSHTFAQNTNTRAG